MRGLTWVRCCGVGTNWLKGWIRKLVGSTICALMMPSSSMSRRSTSRKNEAFLPSGPLTVAAVMLGPERSIHRRAGEVRMPRVENTVADVEERLAVELVRAGLGEDLDTAKTETVVFGGERIGIDADLADGFLGRK